MVLVVSYPILVRGRTPGGPDARDEAFVGQDPEDAIHHLTQDGTDLRARPALSQRGRAAQSP